MGKRNDNLRRSIQACLQNGSRLLEEAEWHSYGPSPTALALILLAEEEFAKAFILQLVAEDVLPWTAEVRRSMSSHECKHLVGVIMDWLNPSVEEVVRRSMASLNGEPVTRFPADVANAINIYRHEKIEKFRAAWPERDPEWGGRSRQIADGLLDREKQAALYVSIGADGDLRSEPSATPDRLKEEMERARRFADFAEAVFRGHALGGREVQWIKDILRVMFEDLAGTWTCTGDNRSADNSPECA